MKFKNLKHFLLIIPFITSCSKQEIKRVNLDKGRAIVTINNYLNAKTNIDFSDNQSLKSIVNFDKDILVENVLNFNTKFYVKKDSFSIIEDSDFNNKISTFYHLSKKPFGMSFLPTRIKGMNKKNEYDTIIENKNHKVVTFENISEVKTFYLKKTDSLYSYSLSDSLENKYKAIITNVQIYNKADDLFTSIYIDYKNNLTTTEEQIINFNKYINKQ